MEEYYKYIFFAFPFAEIAKEKLHDSVFMTSKNLIKLERLIMALRRENGVDFTVPSIYAALETHSH